MAATVQTRPVVFACPGCKRLLRSSDSALYCDACNRTYPIVGGIPDFVSEDVLDSFDPNYRSIKKMEFLAPIYEGQLWQGFVLKILAGARSSSLRSIASFVGNTLEGITGAVLDVACGPATYGRRVASPARSVCGVDFSMGTLRQGLANIERDGVSGIRLARARVEELPFENAVFDGAICCGALHLFPDTVIALREIARTMKPGAPLAVTTFTTANAGILHLINRSRNVRLFEVPELEQYLIEAGFEEFQPILDGAFLTFSARKAIART
jgi:SAM-dependent methyltransferase